MDTTAKLCPLSLPKGTLRPDASTKSRQVNDKRVSDRAVTIWACLLARLVKCLGLENIVVAEQSVEAQCDAKLVRWKEELPTCSFRHGDTTTEALAR